MSGVYINGMKMPTTCGKCTLKYAIECENWKRVRSVVLDRHRCCPLVPVPDHGDLIERDSLPWYLKDVTEILEAPTIIPADKGDEE